MEFSDLSRIVKDYSKHSSISASLNALSAICWEDFLKPVFKDRLSEGQEALVTKFLVLLFGGAGTGMAFMAKTLGGTVLQAALSFVGAASGPILGMFCLGAFFPWSNWIGAVTGGILGLALPMWISIGAYTVIGAPAGLKSPTYNCSLFNTTESITTTVMYTQQKGISGLNTLYTVSYLWYPGIGLLTVIIVGLFVSLITGRTHIGEVDTHYLVPFFDRLICCLPASVSRFLRCYQEFEDPEQIRATEKDQELYISAPPNTDMEIKK